MKISPEVEKNCFFGFLLFVLIVLVASIPMFVVGAVLGITLEQNRTAIEKWYNDLKRKRKW